MTNPKGRTLLVRILLICAVVGQILKHADELSCSDVSVRWMAESGSIRFVLGLVGILILIGGLEESEGTSKAAIVLMIYYFCCWLLTEVFAALFGGSTCYYGLGGPLFSLLYLGSQEGSHKYWWMPYAVLAILIPVSPSYFILHLSGMAAAFVPINSLSAPIEDCISQCVDPPLHRFLGWAGYVRFDGYNILPDTGVSITII
eukprot:TRINITY_DN2709_c0_g1_i1.p1 TRINITY_DN2709_c0_g1~~TRINITY_DN2709_c0_g1_i1.p1  ORF type:complete len:202 (+),score=26.73 TRINITY_DN2709_c0_g1_i1:41-646(+)